MTIDGVQDLHPNQSRNQPNQCRFHPISHVLLHMVFSRSGAEILFYTGLLITTRGYEVVEEEMSLACFYFYCTVLDI